MVWPECVVLVAGSVLAQMSAYRASWPPLQTPPDGYPALRVIGRIYPAFLFSLLGNAAVSLVAWILIHHWLQASISSVQGKDILQPAIAFLVGLLPLTILSAIIRELHARSDAGLAKRRDVATEWISTPTKPLKVLERVARVIHRLTVQWYKACWYNLERESEIYLFEKYTDVEIRSVYERFKDVVCQRNLERRRGNKVEEQVAALRELDNAGQQNSQLLRTYGPANYERLLLQTRGKLLTRVYRPLEGLTVISYHLTKPKPARVEILDTEDRVVRVLTDGSDTVGVHELTWDGRCDHGHHLASGTYFYRLLVNDEQVGPMKEIVLR
ncbi:FlgD immunoglobulin-like domain containing protein [Candidatus Eisenbacteria bacterium]|uniref:FlgD immunoglobulin-like domain containing protein n=1 Tax=Eiseniibacteriota bacterium TaxID=2212470 RepID=A0ABV6YJF3_UNCEI